MPDSTRFGRYEVEEEVARGGMGMIHRVRNGTAAETIEPHQVSRHGLPMSS